MKWFKLTVFCFIICVVQCSGMSKSELEDFADHLEKTSKLDVVLLKGNPQYDYDEDEKISDFAWEDSGKFEGDIILNDRQRKLLVEDVAEGLARNGLRDSTKRWPNNEVIYYIQKEHFNGDQVQAIMSGIEDLAQVSCIQFRPYKKGDRSAVVIQGSRRGCFSQVGYQGGYQVLNLSRRHPVGRGCFRHGTVVHELLHSLGFYHMQSSPDRDDYIDVLWQNIVEPARHNFRKYNTFSVTDFGVGYDYDSVLHYSRRAFSVNGKDTLVPKQSGVSIGQRSGLSDKDAKKLNKMYCDADSNDAHSADENEKQKSAKEKKSKGMPFQGHGIGYHQGKTVVIKVNPEPKTYKITSTIPRYHVFDHFSTTPQALSPTSFFEETRTAKEIKYEYTTSNYNPELLSYGNNNSTGEGPTNYIKNNLDKPLDSPTPNNDVKTNDNEIQTEHSNESTDESADESTDESAEESTDESTEEEDTTTEVIDTVNEAIDRLGKIIKTHVYPSQKPDLDIYKIKPYDSEIVGPTTKHEPNLEIAELDKVFSTKPSFFKTIVPEPNIKAEADEELSGKFGKENKTEIQYENITNYPHYDKDTSVIPDYDKGTYHKESISNSPNHKEEQEQLSKEKFTIYKYGYPLFMNYLRYKSPSYYNDKLYSKETDLLYKPKSGLYNKFDDRDEKDFGNIYTGRLEFEDVTKDEPKEEIETVEEPTSKEVELSYKASYPLHTLIKKVKEEIIETPHFDSLETLEHPENKDVIETPHFDSLETLEHPENKDVIETPYFDSLKTLEHPENKDDNFTKANDEFSGHAVPLQNNWYTGEHNQNVNKRYSNTSHAHSVPNEEKDSFQNLQLIADLKTIQILGKLPGDNNVYHLFGVLVPVKQEGSIQQTTSSKDNT